MGNSLGATFVVFTANCATQDGNNNNLWPFQLLGIWATVFLVIIPYLAHYLGGIHNKDLVVSISESIREPCSRLSVLTFALLVMIYYVGVCAYTPELKAILSVPTIMLVLVTFINPHNFIVILKNYIQIPEDFNRVKDYLHKREKDTNADYTIVDLKDALNEIKLPPKEQEIIIYVFKVHEKESKAHAFIAVLIFSFMTGAMWWMTWTPTVYYSTGNNPNLAIHWLMFIASIIASLIYIILLGHALLGVRWKGKTSGIEWILLFLFIGFMFAYPQAVIRYS